MDSTNTHEPDFGPSWPLYPQLDQLVRVIGPAVAGPTIDGSPLYVYPCLLIQFDPVTLTSRNRVVVYVVEPNNVKLGPAIYDSRLVGSWTPTQTQQSVTSKSGQTCYLTCILMSTGQIVGVPATGGGCPPPWITGPNQYDSQSTAEWAGVVFLNSGNWPASTCGPGAGTTPVNLPTAPLFATSCCVTGSFSSITSLSSSSSSSH